jgi:hypothetical protein
MKASLFCLVVLALSPAALAQTQPTPKELFERGMASWGGKGAVKDVDKGRALLTQAAQQRYLDAFSALGLLEISESAKGAGMERGSQWFYRGAFVGDPRSLAMTATLIGARVKGSPFQVALEVLAAEADPKFAPMRDADLAGLDGLGRFETEALAEGMRAQIAINKGLPLPLQFPADGIVSRGDDGLPRVVESYGAHATFSGGRGESCDKPARLETPIPFAMVRAGAERAWLNAVYPGWNESQHATRAAAQTGAMLSVYDLKKASGESRQVCIDISQSQVMLRKDFVLNALRLEILSRCQKLPDPRKQVCSDAAFAAVKKCSDAVSIPERIPGSDPRAMQALVGGIRTCTAASPALRDFPIGQ